MQALFLFPAFCPGSPSRIAPRSAVYPGYPSYGLTPLALAFDAAGFIEADLATVALTVAVVVARQAILGADLVRRAQAALDVGAGHAAEYLLLDHGVAARAAGDAIAAAVLLFADHHHQAAGFLSRCAANCFAGFRQGHGLAAAGSRVVGVLQLLVLLDGAALQGEGDMAAGVFAAKHGRGQQWGGAEQDGAASCAA